MAILKIAPSTTEKRLSFLRKSEIFGDTTIPLSCPNFSSAQRRDDELECKITLREAVRITVERKLAANRRKAYVATLRQYLELFIRGREELNPNVIQAADIEEWFDLRGEKPATRASNLGRLSAMFSLLWRRGHIESNPCDKVERITIERGSPRILTLEQIRKMVNATRLRAPEILAYAVLGLWCGLRPMEAQRMKWQWINAASNTVIVPAEITKIRRRRVVNVMPNAAEWLGQGGELPLTTKAVREWRLLVREELGVPAYPQDVLRHTCASMWLARVRDAGKVAFELGTSQAILQRHYMELVTQEQAAAFWSLRPTRAEQLQLNL